MDRVQAHRTDIQKLAEKDKIKGGLKSIQDREPIGGGFTPFNKKAFAGNSNAGAGTDGGVDPEDPNSFAEPDPSDPDNPNNKGGTNNRDPLKDGPQDIDDLLDEEAGPTLPDDSVSDPFSGGSLNKITGLKDCDTGQCVTAHLDGRFPTPDGWDDPDTPPPLEGWESGTVWFGSFQSECAWTALEAAEKHTAFGHGEGVYTVILMEDVPTTAGKLDTQRATAVKNSHPFNTIQFIVDKHSCSTLTGGSCGACDSDPVVDAWPEDGCYDVAMIDGQVQTNEYDSEAPASAKEARSAATFCTAKGNKAMIRAAVNGGTMLYPVTASGSPTGIVKVYNSNGTLRSAGDASQQNIDSQLPR